jgi:hypothetical protein
MDEESFKLFVQELERDPSKAKLPLEIYRRTLELQRIGNQAVRAAQEENRRLGIPNAYSRNGRLYFELPNGEITETDPFESDPAAE